MSRERDSLAADSPQPACPFWKREACPGRCKRFCAPLFLFYTGEMPNISSQFSAGWIRAAGGFIGL